MIVTLNRKVRDRIPASVPEVAKKCSPPRPGTGAPRGRKPNTTALQRADLDWSRFPGYLRLSQAALASGLLAWNFWRGLALGRVSGRRPS